MLRRHGILIGLFLVSAASLLFEILLTKFFGSKLEHHFSFAVIGMAMLGFGAAGVYVHLRPERFPIDGGPDPEVLGRHAFGFTLSCLVAIPVFCGVPIDPVSEGWGGVFALPLFFLMFAVPFFFVGVCVSYTLIAASQRPGVIYFWDLAGAGLGAAGAAAALSLLGGYGATALVGALGLLGALVYWHAAGAKPWSYSLRWRLPLAALATAVLLLYPSASRTLFGHDIATSKYGSMREVFLNDFHGLQMSFWNAIARIDVSKIGDAQSRAYRGGIPHRFDRLPIPGRYILVDGGAVTRQLALRSAPPTQEFLKHTLWATPYVTRDPAQPAERTLVIGAGGGLDILVAKAFRTRHIDALELNPDTYRLLMGRPEDPVQGRFLPWIHSDDTSEVTILNVEARHFCHTSDVAERYDVIEGSGIDTLTSIASAANALSENFLYTEDAIADFYRLLKPGGILSLSHGYVLPGALTLRKFVTYLSFLDHQGVEHPGRSVAFVFDHYFENALLKKGEFTREEISRLERWVKQNDYRFIYHPFQPPDTPLVRPMGDELAKLDDQAYAQVVKYFAPFIDPTRATVDDADLPFHDLAHAANAAARQAILDELPWNVEPSTDERPYFFFIGPRRTTWASALDGAFVHPQPAVRWMFLAAVLGAIALLVAPLLGRSRGRSGDEGAAARRSVLAALPFFALTGFAFMLVENAAFLHLTLFVGGPLYSLSIVLPCVLVGYSVGSLLTSRYLVGWRHGLIFLLALYPATAALYLAGAQYGLPMLVGQSWTVRVLVAILATLPLGAVIGIPVPWYMESLKQTDSRSLAWMWAVSSAFNVLGTMSFVVVCFAIGRTWTAVLAAGLYLLAVIWAGVVRVRPARQAPEPT